MISYFRKFKELDASVWGNLSYTRYKLVLVKSIRSLHKFDMPSFTHCRDMFGGLQFKKMRHVNVTPPITW